MKILEKIFLREAIELLSFHNKPIDYVINSLMNEESISAYFDVNVYATKATGYQMRTIDQDGAEIPYVDGAPPKLIAGSRKKIIEAYIEKGNKLSVLRFKYQGDSYCGADSDGFDLKPIVLDFDDIYFDKSEIHSVQDLPPYQDKNHENYAPELDLAIQLHKAIYIDKYGNQGQSREDRISSWLKNEYSEYHFADAAIARLSTVIGDKPLKLKKK